MAGHDQMAPGTFATFLAVAGFGSPAGVADELTCSLG